MNRLFLLDAFALIFRAYYAFVKKPLINSKGFNSSAIHGFVNTLLDILQKEKPTHISVCFDAGEITQRAIEHSFYKANRAETPETISLSTPIIKQILAFMNISCVELVGYEADDIIGTIAHKAEKDNCAVFMVTMDKDLGQLVTKNVKMYRPKYLGKGYDVLGIAEICERWQIDDAKKVIDILGLMGDSVDNIPGLPGVGEKTAIKLIQEFGNVENVLSNGHLLKGKLHQTVMNNAPLAIISKKLATIITDVPIDYNLNSYLLQEPNRELLTPIFAQLELKALGKRIIGNTFSVTQKTNSDLFNIDNNIIINSTHKEPKVNDVMPKNSSNTSHLYELIDTEVKVKALIETLLSHKIIAFDTETTGLEIRNAEIVGISFAIKPHHGFYVPMPENVALTKALLQQFLPIFHNINSTLIGQNIKFDILQLKNYDIELTCNIEDTMLMHYVMNADLRHNMNFLAEQYLNYSPIEIKTLIGKKKQTSTYNA